MTRPLLWPCYPLAQDIFNAFTPGRSAEKPPTQRRGEATNVEFWKKKEKGVLKQIPTLGLLGRGGQKNVHQSASPAKDTTLAFILVIRIVAGPAKRRTGHTLQGFRAEGRVLAASQLVPPGLLPRKFTSQKVYWYRTVSYSSGEQRHSSFYLMASDMNGICFSSLDMLLILHLGITMMPAALSNVPSTSLPARE